MNGMFITFEGGEGTGKSTQIKMLADYLAQQGIVPLITKEPGGTPLGQELRRILVTGDKDKLDAAAEALLFFADRHIHLTSKVWPAMERGEWVLSDRFADSSIAYQYYGHNKRLSMEDLQNLYKIAAGDFKPDLTIILDIEPEIGLKRSLARNATVAEQEVRFENIDISFHQRLRQGYIEIAKSDPERCVVFDANKTIEELHQNIIKVVSERLGL